MTDITIPNLNGGTTRQPTSSAKFPYAEGGVDYPATLAQMTAALGGGAKAYCYLGTAPVLTDFTQHNITSNYSATDYSGKGIYIKDSTPGTGFSLAGLSKTLPTAPYRVVIAIQPTQPYPINYLSWCVGFSDGTKFDVYGQYDGTTAASVQWTNTTTRSASGSLGIAMPAAPLIFFSLEDDGGTTVKIGYSLNAVGPFYILRTITKSSGHLGSSGYTKGFVGLSNYGSGGASGTTNAYGLGLRDWDEAGLTRLPFG